MIRWVEPRIADGRAVEHEATGVDADRAPDPDVVEAARWSIGIDRGPGQPGSCNGRQRRPTESRHLIRR